MKKKVVLYIRCADRKQNFSTSGGAMAKSARTTFGESWLKTQLLERHTGHAERARTQMTAGEGYKRRRATTNV